MDSKRIWRIGVIIVILLLVFGLLYALRNAFLPVFIALVLAYILDPVVHRLEALKLGRTSAILILAALSIAVIAGLGTLLAIQAQRETVTLYQNLPGYLARVQDKAEPIAREYFGVQIPKTLDEALAALKDQVSKINPSTLKPVSGFVSGLTGKTIALVGWLFSLLIIPILLFYFLRDFHDLQDLVKSYLPAAHRDYALAKFEEVDAVLGAFVRGQLTVCLILGLLYSAGLVAVGVDMAVVIGMLAGIAFIVPYFGTVVGIVLATVMSLLENGISWQLPAAWAVFAVAQVIETYFVTPRIMGKKVGLKPVVIILAILIGANLLGFLGILIAVPTAAVIKVFLKDAVQRYKQSSFFLEKPEPKSPPEQKP